MAARAEVKEETLKPDPASIQEHDLAWHSFIDTSNSFFFKKQRSTCRTRRNRGAQEVKNT
jgi:hypothetical protein